jgi:hypothetical protein
MVDSRPPICSRCTAPTSVAAYSKRTIHRICIFISSSSSTAVGTAAPTTPDASYKIPGNLETARSLSTMWDEVVLALGPFAQEGLARLRLAFLESIVENSEVQPWYRDELTTPQLRDLQRSLVARDMLETVASIRRSMIQ